MATQARAEAAGRRIVSEAQNVDKFKTPARLGYAARGGVYLIVGALAVLAAMGSGGETTDTKGALQSLMGEPFGMVILALVAVGLLAFSGWRAVQAIADVDRHGSDAKAWVIRGGLLVSAVTHLLLAVFAASLIFGVGGGSGGAGGGGTQGWVAQLMQQPYGVWLVGLVGAAIVGAGIAQIIKGWQAKFEKRLDVSYDKLGWIRPICRFGLIARGVVFGIIGGFIIVAAWQHDPQEARGLSGALETLQGQPFGQVLLGIVALGLVAFGVYCFIEAAYRRLGIGQVKVM